MTQQELLPALNFTPAVITFNFEELRRNIEKITAQYQGAVVREEDVPAYKEEMAALNKLKVLLSEARKKAVSEISAPIKEFENQIKVLEDEISTTRAFLDEQVKAHIQRERDGRRAAVQFMIDAQKDEHGCKDLDIQIQESWLNKTAKDKQITAEIQSIILAYKQQVEDAIRLEQARKDRIHALESRILAKSRETGKNISFAAFAFLQDVQIPLDEALKKVDEIFLNHAEAAIHNQTLAGPKLEQHWLDAPDEKPILKSMFITATYDASYGLEMRSLYARMKAVCVTCSVKIEEISKID